MERRSSVYIVTPRDGNYGDIKYPGSGMSVASAFDTALQRYSDDVVVGGLAETAAVALATAKEKKCVYLIIPKITRWEDRATEWSGKRDKMELFVRIIRVEDGSELRSAEIQGRSSWATFGGDHPQDLLKEPVTEFVGSLF
jgi:hypothetical protein